eukprot:CAMPEP_0171593272 /NCGR_PEP_ID=MMETSP0990-20121206/8_1 /TAXON_ID=483369 /ORGANISM="non described non described, Strain CCMP2098" /LENGTH=109 /DNA_ID=CAMNT_0012153765 /DNA_START=425 /DNA_END=754 /DNA_ORIENTATION=+
MGTVSCEKMSAVALDSKTFLFVSESLTSWGNTNPAPIVITSLKTNMAQEASGKLRGPPAAPAAPNQMANMESLVTPARMLTVLVAASLYEVGSATSAFSVHVITVLAVI